MEEIEIQYTIHPTDNQLKEWVRNFVPDYDLFFLAQKDVQLFQPYLNSALLIPKAEFFKHSSYNQIQMVNSYEFWKISNEADCVIVAGDEWFKKLPFELKKQLSGIQMMLGRGLVFPVSMMPNLDSLPDDILVEKDGELFLVVNVQLWRELSKEMKKSLIIEYAKGWDDWNCYDYPVTAPVHLKEYANIFPSRSGSNCLSAVLFALTKQEWILHEWVHPETFVSGLVNAQYEICDSTIFEAGDVLVWRDQHGRIQHASFHIGENQFFNKNGQTFFNPWKIVHWSELNKEWEEFVYSVYRKIQLDILKNL